MKPAGLIALGLVGAVINIIWRGYVIAILWAWFVATALHAPTIGTAQAIGLSCIAGLFHADRELPKSDKDFGTQMAEAFVKGLLAPLFALAFGAIVKCWL